MFRLSRALFVAMVSVLVFSGAVLRSGPGAVTRAAPGGRGRSRQMAHSSCWILSFFTLRTRIGLTDYFVHHSLFCLSCFSLLLWKNSRLKHFTLVLIVG